MSKTQFTILLLLLTLLLFTKKIILKMDTAAEITKAVQTLMKGGSILYPTDTVWGIGCDATDEQAVEKVMTIKNKAPNQSLILLWHDIESLGDYAEQVPENLADILGEHSNPVTIIYPAGKNIAASVLHTDGSIAIRVTQNEFCVSLLKEFKKPIVSTSANLSGKPFPSSFSEVDDDILNRVDYVVNLPEEKQATNTPSSIIKIMPDGEIHTIRDSN